MPEANLTITEFLEARIAEDEAAARAAIHLDFNPNDDGVWEISNYSYEGPRVEGIGITIYDEGGHTVEQARHIARHDPARALAECAAKRAIIEAHKADGFDCWSCGDQYGRAPYPCMTLLHLAAVYKDHPDYDKEWAIE